MTDNFCLASLLSPRRAHSVSEVGPLAFYSCQHDSVFALQNRMHMVIGKPIEIPKLEAPTKEEVQRYLDEYIAALQALFERHKVAAGCPDMRLIVI